MSFEKIKFCEIDIDELVTGQKYMIQEISYQHTIIYYSVFSHYVTGYITEWNKPSYRVDTPYTGIKYKPTMRFEKINLNNLTKKASFFKLICSKEKIQNAMELRAINLILQNIIGDKTFTY
jgi:hypothetical protein